MQLLNQSSIVHARVKHTWPSRQNGGKEEQWILNQYWKKNEHKDWYSKQIDTTAVWNSDSNNSDNQAIFSKCV